jgi:hypothetical protein
VVSSKDCLLEPSGPGVLLRGKGGKSLRGSERNPSEDRPYNTSEHLRKVSHLHRDLMDQRPLILREYHNISEKLTFELKITSMNRLKQSQVHY